MIKLKNLLKEASEQNYSFEELKDMLKIWKNSNLGTDPASKKAVQVLYNIGYLKSAKPGKALVNSIDFNKSTYVTTDGKGLEDLDAFRWALIKAELNLPKEEPKTDPEPVKKRKFSFDFGNQLLTDPNVDTSDPENFKKFLKKWNYKTEPNTEDENDFLDDLQTYTSSEGHGNMLKVLKTVAPLKNKFPGILDPTKSTNATKFVYRGTTIPVNLLQNTNFNDAGYNLEFNKPVTLKSKGTKGFLSFSTNDDAAYNFATKGGEIVDDMKKLVKKGLIPAIICLPISDPKLIFNPDFVMNFSPSDFKLEQETFYLGKELTAKKILIPKSVLDSISDNLNVAPPEYKTVYQNIISKLK